MSSISILMLSSAWSCSMDLTIRKKQILMCFAQDAALSDAIITLGEGFHHGLFPEGLESYLKKVRALSRQQFYLRATMIKARQVSGLQSESS